MHPARTHPTAPTRGVRDPRTCKVQAGGQLRAIVTLPGVYDRQPMYWTDRPMKFPGHLSIYLRKPGARLEDVRWRQLDGRAWWRMPAWPDGNAQGPAA